MPDNLCGVAKLLHRLKRVKIKQVERRVEEVGGFVLALRSPESVGKCMSFCRHDGYEVSPF